MKARGRSLIRYRRAGWLAVLATLTLVVAGVLVGGDPSRILAAPVGGGERSNSIELNRMAGITTITPVPCTNNDPHNPYNTFDKGQCTWWAWERRHQVGQDLPSVAWGDAKDWLGAAQAAGYLTGTTPVVGAVLVCQPGACGGAFATGHVAYVEKVISSTSFQVSEQNWIDGPCTNDVRTVSTGPGEDFILFLGATPAATVASAKTPTMTPTNTLTVLPTCTPAAVLPSPSPFPTETRHSSFLPAIVIGGPVVCSAPTPPPPV